MLLIDIPEMPGDETQLVYHALGRTGTDALVLTRSTTPYMCVGFSGGIAAELDTDFCKKKDIGIFRREIGGGTVLIDRPQLLIQLAIRRDDDAVPAGQVNFFKKFLWPLASAYADIGIDVEFRPVNDLLASGKKISGTGGGEIGDCNILATNILLDFDFDRMAGALNCPSEAFRKAVRAAMEEEMTTVKRELGTVPPLPSIRKAVRARYEELLGPLSPAPLPGAVREEMTRLAVELTGKKWLSDMGAKKKFREIKLREGRYLAQVSSPEGELLLRAADGKVVGAELLDGERYSQDAVRRLTNHFLGAEYSEEQIINIVSGMARR